LEPRPPKKLPFCEINDSGRKNALFAQKIIFCEKVASGAKNANFAPKMEKRGKGGPKHQRNDRFRSSLRNGAGMVQKVTPKRKNTHFFAKMILRAKNGFGAKKVKLSEKVRNGGKWSPKHLKKDRFRKVLSDRAGNGIPDTKKVDFPQKSHFFAPKRKFPKCCELFAKSAPNPFLARKVSVPPLKQSPNQRFWEVILLRKKPPLIKKLSRPT